MSDIERLKFNIFLLGDTQVGKTSMIEALEGKPFRDTNLSTIGVDFIFKSAVFDGKKYDFKIYDTAGQERYRSISKSTIKITDGFLLVFSVNNRKSFELINYWYDSIKDVIDIKRKVIILIGNKIDLPNREVTNAEAVSFAKSKNIKYFETSAKTGFGIKEAFRELYQEIYDLFKSSKEKTENNIDLNEGNKDKKESKCC